MKKKKLVYKSKFGDIPIIQRKDVSTGFIYIISGDIPLEEFDYLPLEEDGVSIFSLHSKLKQRRISKMTKI